MNSHSVSVLLLFMFPYATFTKGNQCPNITSRSEWNARDPEYTTELKTKPPNYVVVHHSATPECFTKEDCKTKVQAMQRYHMDTNKWEDIGYNFLIGGDGSIFEGRGWGLHGAHAIPYNSRSIGICLIGNFMAKNQTEAQEKAMQNLIKCGVEKGEIDTNYHLIGHRQATPTLCPGDVLYNKIKEDSHFQENPSK